MFGLLNYIVRLVTKNEIEKANAPVGIMPGQAVPMQEEVVQVAKKPAGFLKVFFIALTFSWIFAPLVIDMGANGGISGPLPGGFFLIPILGQLAFVLTVIASPVLLFASILGFNLYVTLLFLLSRKITDRKFSQVLFVIVGVILCWWLMVFIFKKV